MLVLFGYMALDHCTVINSVRPFLFVHKEQFNIICFFLFLNLNTFWVLRFLFLWTFTNSFLRPKKPTTAFLKFSKIWVLFLIFRYWVYIIRKFFVMSWANWSSENGTGFLDLPTYLLWPQTSLFLKLTTQWVMGLKIEKNIEYNCDLFHYLFLNLFEIRRIEILWWYMPDIGCKMIH